MLNAFRSLAGTWIGKILGAFLIVGLAGFGISNVLTQLGSTTIATVAGKDVSTRDFQRAYNNQLNTVAQQIGKMPTAEEAMAYGIPSIVLNRLASEAAINKLGEDLGIGVSEARLADMLRNDPSFQGTLGAFDRANFLRVLQQNGYTEAEYFDLQASASRRQQLASGLFGGSPTPQAALELINRYSSDARTVDYFVLNAESMLEVAPPTEDDLAAYLKDHQADFRTKETRTVDILTLSPEILAAAKAPTEEEISAEYEATKASRVKIEKRTIRQIALKTPEQEKLFEDGKTAGKGIGELLTETGLAFSDLGTLSKAEITDQELADAAFGLEVDGYAIISGVGGKRVITVSAIEPGGQISLADAHDDIAKSLALTAARAEYNDILDQIEELRAAFKPLTEIAERFSLKPLNLAVTASGAELEAVADIPAEERGRVAAAIFDAEQGDLDPTISLSSTRNVWFDLKKVEPARDQTLAEVHDAVAAAWTAQETDKALTAEVNDALAKLKAGTPFADVAIALNQAPQLSQPLKRAGDGTTVLNQQVAAEVFNGGPDHFGTAVNGDGDHVVFHVVDVVPATGDAPAQAKQFIENSTRDSIYADFVTGVRDEAGMKINQQALNQLLALDTTGQ